MDQFFKYEKPILKKVNLVQVLRSTKMAWAQQMRPQKPVCPPDHSSFYDLYVYLLNILEFYTSNSD